MDSLLQLDSQLLLLLNYFHSEFWDSAFWLISSTLIWVPMYIMIIFSIIKGQKLQSWITILAVIVLVVLCDQISTEVFKYGFERFRPTHDPVLKDFVKIVNGYRGGKYGFVSSHATNTMGIAVLFSLLFRNRVFSIFIISWCLIVSYSRIYLGVHYPGDIIGGLCLGSLLGFLVYKIYALLIPRVARLTYFNKKGLSRGIAEQFGRAQIYQVVFTGVLTFVIILLASKVL